uniref:Phlebovirus_G2 domain-containing protein n=1 Tax=Heterorhabditis bacteriophora TaxID=37862 RepID=A0A1I7WGF6_HETBA
MKVISITTPQDPLMNHTFTKSTQFTVIVPAHYTTVVRCASRSQARDKFPPVPVRKFVQARTAKSMWITTLPITTPNLHLYEKNSTLVAEMDQIEMTVAIKSRYVVKQSILIRNPTCAVQLSPVQGRYKCLEGAKATALCTTATSSLVEAHCTERTFVIRCGPKRTEQALKLHFNSAIIFERCTTTCGNRTFP